jgi:hypothetical protein
MEPAFRHPSGSNVCLGELLGILPVPEQTQEVGDDDLLIDTGGVGCQLVSVGLLALDGRGRRGAPKGGGG